MWEIATLRITFTFAEVRAFEDMLVRAVSTCIAIAQAGKAIANNRIVIV
jgi:hypothetical protein